MRPLHIKDRLDALEQRYRRPMEDILHVHSRNLADSHDILAILAVTWHIGPFRTNGSVTPEFGLLD